MAYDASGSTRSKIGWIGLVLMAVGMAAFVPGPFSSMRFLAGAAMKVGMVCALTWLAYPQLVLLPRWFAASVVGCALLVAALAQHAKPLLPFILGAIVVLLVLARLTRRSA